MRVESTDIEKKFLSIATVGAQGQFGSGLCCCEGESVKEGDLEDDSCCNLHLTVVDFRRRDCSEGCAIERSSRQRKDWVVGDIEDLPSELCCDSFAHGNCFHQGHVEVYVSRTNDVVAACVAEDESRLLREERRSPDGGLEHDPQ
jgi:hypothetical protein